MGKKSSTSRDSGKRQAPYNGFPLTIRTDGRLCKKFDHQVYYFGRIDKWQDAIEKYEHEWPYIVDHRTPPPTSSDGCTVGELCNLFLTAKKTKLDAGELVPRTWADYYRVCESVIDQFGTSRRVDDLRPADFAALRKTLSKRMGVVALRNDIGRIRVLLKYGFDERLLQQPVHYGQGFQRPSARSLREARNQRGLKMFESDEICRMLNAADPVLRSMILCGCNCAFGQADISTLPRSAVDLEKAWVHFPRPKTAIERHCPLWPETVAALRIAIPLRPKPVDPAHDDLVFLTKYGKPWVRTQPTKKDPTRLINVDSLSQEFRKLLKRLDINGRRGFYCFRRTFETIGSESKDQIPLDLIMGHLDTSMAATYRQRLSDDRLIRVAETVHDWLFPSDEDKNMQDE